MSENMVVAVIVGELFLLLGWWSLFTPWKRANYYQVAESQQQWRQRYVLRNILYLLWSGTMIPAIILMVVLNSLVLLSLVLGLMILTWLIEEFLPPFISPEEHQGTKRQKK